MLLDIGLPQMDGYEAARRLIAGGFKGRLIAISGYGEVKDKQRAAAAGFYAHLSKPVDYATLEKVDDRALKWGLTPFSSARISTDAPNSGSTMPIDTMVAASGKPMRNSATRGAGIPSFPPGLRRHHMTMAETHRVSRPMAVSSPSSWLATPNNWPSCAATPMPTMRSTSGFEPNGWSRSTFTVDGIQLELAYPGSVLGLAADAPEGLAVGG